MDWSQASTTRPSPWMIACARLAVSLRRCSSIWLTAWHPTSRISLRDQSVLFTLVIQSDSTDAEGDGRPPEIARARQNPLNCRPLHHLHVVAQCSSWSSHRARVPLPHNLRQISYH